MSARRMIQLALFLSCLTPALLGAQAPADLQSAMKTRDARNSS